MFYMCYIKKLKDLNLNLSRGFCYVQVNSLLKPLLSTFTRTQNAPAELRRRYQMKFSILILFAIFQVSVHFHACHPKEQTTINSFIVVI